HRPLPSFPTRRSSDLIAIERVAYRPLRDSNRLAPLITAIGVSLLLEGVVQVRISPGTVLVPTNALIPQVVAHIGSVATPVIALRSEEHTSELQSLTNL